MTAFSLFSLYLSYIKNTMTMLLEQAKMERMLVMMKKLSDNDEYSVNDLAKEFNTTVRSIYRYIATFEDAGFAVVKKAPGIYSLTTMGSKIVDFSKLVMFSREEAFVVNELISRLDNSNTLKKTLARKLSAVASSTCIADFVTNKATTKQVETLNEAITKKQRVILRQYESGHSNTVRDRYVEPVKFTTNMTEVNCYDLEEEGMRTFKISRMNSVEILPEKCDRQEFYKIDDHDAFRMSGDTDIPVKLHLSLYAKNLLVEEYPLAAKDIHKTSTGKWILNTKVRALQGIGRFVIGLADEITILNGPELVEYIRNYQPKIDSLLETAR